MLSRTIHLEWQKVADDHYCVTDPVGWTYHIEKDEGAVHEILLQDTGYGDPSGLARTHPFILRIKDSRYNPEIEPLHSKTITRSKTAKQYKVFDIAVNSWPGEDVHYLQMIATIESLREMSEAAYLVKYTSGGFVDSMKTAIETISNERETRKNT